MKLTIDLTELHQMIIKTIESALENIPEEKTMWEYYTLKEASELLQIKTATLLDKRMPFINELEYAQSGRIFWFKKTSVEKFVTDRIVKKHKR